VCEQLFAPYVAIQEVSDRLSFCLSLLSRFFHSIRPILFFDEEKIVPREFSPFSRNIRWLYVVLIEVIQSYLTVPPENEISILTERALRKKGVGDRYRYGMTFRVRTRAAFSFHFFSFFL